MGFGALIFYLVFAYLRPFDFYPWLAPYHLMQIIGGIGILLTLSYLPLARIGFSTKQLYLMPLFVLLASASRVFALRWFGGAATAMEELSITTSVFMMVMINVSNIRRLRILLRTTVILALLLVFLVTLAVHYGVFANLLLLRVFMQDERTMVWYTASVRARATGFLQDPNDFGQALVSTLPFVWLAWQKHNLFRNILLVLLPASFLIYGIYLTHSRGTLVSLIVTILIAGTWRLGRLGGGIIASLGMAAAFVVNFTGGRALSGSDESATSRLEAWSNGLQALRAHPLFGVGYGQFMDINPGLTAHNSAVLAFTELGFIGFLLWTALLLVGLLELRWLQKLKLEKPEDLEVQRIARAILLSLSGYLVAAWFLSRTYVLTLYLLIALAGVTANLARRQGIPLQKLSFPKLAGLSMAGSWAVIILVYMTIKISIR